jgi:5-methylcytosine-specific restriction endonuclease McrA
VFAKKSKCALCGTAIRSGFSYCTPCSKIAWKKNNSDWVRDSNSARRAKTKEKISRAIVWARDHGICGICKQPADPKNWHLDHVISLKRGGTHTYDNVRVTHPKCNLKKWAH